LRGGELVGALGGVGLLVSLFLQWYSQGDPKGHGDTTGWQAFSITDVVLAAAAAVALSVAICVLFRISVSYPVAGSSVGTGFGAVAVVLIVINLINPPTVDPFFESDPEIGAWLGLVSAIAVTIGGYMGMQPIKAPKTSAA
jgi:hypothetical protein